MYVEKFKGKQVSKEYEEKLERALQGLQVNDWEQCASVMKAVAEEVVGLEEKKQQKGWYDEHDNVMQKRMRLVREHWMHTVQELGMRIIMREEKKMHKKKKEVYQEEQMRALERIYNVRNR